MSGFVCRSRVPRPRPLSQNETGDDLVGRRWTGVQQNAIMLHACNLLKARHLDYNRGDDGNSSVIKGMAATDRTVGEGV